MCGHPVSPALFVEDAVFPPVRGFGTYVEYYTAVVPRACVSISCFISVIYIYICFCVGPIVYYISLWLKTWSGNPSRIVFIAQDCLGYLVLYKF